MRVTRFAAVALLGLPLGGCFGVTLPSQPLPDWAMSLQTQSEQYEEPAAAPVKRRTVRRAAPAEVSSPSTMITGEVSATPQASSKPPAQAKSVREDERDESLRQTMTICRGC